MICHVMDIRQIARCYFGESCDSQEVGRQLYTLPAHGRKRLAHPVHVMLLEKIRLLLLRLCEPESIDHHNATVWP